MRRATVWALVCVVCAAPAWPQAFLFRKPVRAAIQVNFHFDHAGPGVLRDYKCGTATYDGHSGTDFPEARWGAIYAVADGNIYYTEDGWGDGFWGSHDGLGRLGNQVRIHHGYDGSEKVDTYYGHMQIGTPAQQGINVICGDQVGQVGNSGFSSGPHLHLHLKINDVINRDPFAGACGATANTYWVNQGTGNPGTACGTPSPTPSGPTPTPDPNALILIEARNGGQNTGWYTEVNGWANSDGSSTAPGCTGGIGSRYASTFRSVVGHRSARFSPVFAGGGPFEVYVTWPAASNRRAGILYRVAHADGATEVELDQQVNANTWVSLGTFSFNVGAGQYVEVNNERTDVSGAMYAAAVKFEYRGDSATPTPTPSATATPTPSATATPAARGMLELQ